MKKAGNLVFEFLRTKSSSSLPKIGLILLSADAIFVWTVAMSLGDSRFDLVDATFFIQLQSRIIGTLILSWAFAVLFGNADSTRQRNMLVMS